MARMKLATLSLLAAGLLCAGAGAEEAATAPSPALDVGWNTKFGALFGLQNIFQNAGILAGYHNYGVGVQYHLTPSDALRVGLSLGRTANPVFETKSTTNVTNQAPTTQTTLTGTAGPTSTMDFGLGADYLKRLTLAELAPYAGGGLTFSYGQRTTAYEDKVTVANQVTKVNNQSSSYAVGLRGIFGIGWRLHKYLSLFAEYTLGLDLLNHAATNNRQAVTVTAASGTATTTETVAKGSQSRVLNLDVGLSQGASLGLIAFF
jgi:opacity protein-like surface antigen